MEIEKSPVYATITDVIRTCDKQTNSSWSAIIHLDDNGTTYTPLQLLSVNLKRDYISGFADEMTCSVLIPLGKYSRKIYPNRNTLQISLFKTTLEEGTQLPDYDEPIGTERYSATLLDDGPSATNMQGQETVDEFSLDLSDILTVHFQLFNKAVEKVRMISVGGINRSSSVKDVLLTTLTNNTAKLKVDNKRAILGIDLEEPTNKDKTNHIILKQGLKLIDLPDYLQQKYGVFNAGIGSYIQNSHWFIYPLYDTTRFETELNTITIYVLPKRKFPEIERTYRVIGKSIVILCTSETAFKDDSGTNYLNEGNGVRFMEGSKIMDGGFTTGGNKATIARGKNVNEFLAEARPDNVNHVPMSDERITSNPYLQYSKLASRKGGIFKAIWENSKPSLILPGMVSKIIYVDEDTIKEAYGVVLAANHTTTKVGDLQSIKFSTGTQLSLFVNLKNETD